MSLKTLGMGVLLAVGLSTTTGCVVRTITTAPAPLAVASTSWIRQVQLRIAPSTSARVASLGQSSWHLVQLKVGRLDGAMPIRSITFDPYDGPPSSRALDGLAPGGGYWVQADLVHVDPDGEQTVVGSGRLGGGAENVIFHAGSNSVPIPVAAVVAGGRLDMSPTPLRRTSRRPSLDGFVAIGSGSASLPTASSTPGPIVMPAPSVASAEEDEAVIHEAMDWLGEEAGDEEAVSDEDAGWDDYADDSDDSDDEDWSDWVDEDSDDD